MEMRMGNLIERFVFNKVTESKNLHHTPSIGGSIVCIVAFAFDSLRDFAR